MGRAHLPFPTSGEWTHPNYRRRLADCGSGPVVLGEAAQRGVEAGVERLLQSLRRQARRLLPVVGKVDEAGHERPRGGAAQRLLAVEIVEEVSERLLVECDALAVALVSKDAAEGLRRRVADADLVRHAAQEGFVDELGG